MQTVMKPPFISAWDTETVLRLNYNSKCQALHKTNRDSLAWQPWNWTLAQHCTHSFHLHAWLLQLTLVKYTNMHKALWVRTGPIVEYPVCGGKSVCASHLIKTWGVDWESWCGELEGFKVQGGSDDSPTTFTQGYSYGVWYWDVGGVMWLWWRHCCWSVIQLLFVCLCSMISETFLKEYAKREPVGVLDWYAFISEFMTESLKRLKTCSYFIPILMIYSVEGDFLYSPFPVSSLVPKRGEPH